jgi:hypothetical protein
MAFDCAFGRLAGTLEGVVEARRCKGIASTSAPTQRSAKAILYDIYFSSTILACFLPIPTIRNRAIIQCPGDPTMRVSIQFERRNEAREDHGLGNAGRWNERV